MLSLLLANFGIPLIAPKAKAPLQPADEVRAIMDIYRSVIHSLVEQRTPADKLAAEIVIRQYNNRIAALKQSNNISDPEEDALRRRIIGWEREHTLTLIDEDKVSFKVGSLYIYQLSRLLARIEHHGEKQWLLKGWLDQIWHRLTFARRWRREHGKVPGIGSRAALVGLQELQRVNYRYVLRRLDTLMSEPDAPIRAINMVVSDFRRRLSRLEGATRPLAQLSQQKNRDFEARLSDVETEALNYEREAIKSAQAHGRISRATAGQLFDNVAMMELDIEEHLE
jgi:CPA1 family monovalent cation:H+ antiporter